jgi:hypothetical protein
MSLRIILIASGVVGILFGLFFLFGAESAIASYNLGDSTLPARLFARATGAALISFGVINILASSDTGSSALRAVVIGNIVVHLMSLGVDFSESYARNGGVWVGLAVHIIFIVAFGWALLNWGKMARA